MNEQGTLVGGMTLTGENAALGQTLVAAPLSPPQIPHGLAWN